MPRIRRSAPPGLAHHVINRGNDRKRVFHQRGDYLAFLRFMEAEAAAGWFVNDLHRHGFAYATWPLLATAMGWHPIVRTDGHTSIARSFRAAEWHDLLDQAGVPAASVRRWFPFRLCVERLR